MSKKSMVEQLREKGVVAAHLNDRRVEFVRNVPKRVTFSTPFFQEKKPLKKGDKIAIVDMDDGSAYICKIAKVSGGLLSAPVFDLEGARLVRLG